MPFAARPIWINPALPLGTATDIPVTPPTDDQQRIRVVNVAVRTRTDMLRRQAKPRLEAPAVVEPSLLGSDPRLVVKTHVVQTRPRPTQGIVEPPATLEPWSVALRERTPVVQTVALRAARPRPTQGTLEPPATLEPWSIALQERTITTRLVPELRLDRRSAHFKLSAPTVVTVPAVFTAPPISVTNAAVRTRIERQHHRSLSILGGPVVVSGAVTFPGTKVTEVRIRPRATRYKLSPPTVVTAAPAAPLARPILTSIAVERRVGRAQRLPFWRLSYPVLVEAAMQPPDRRLEIAVTLAPPDRRIRLRRRAFSSLGGPVVILAPALVTKTATTLVAVASRVQRVRRAKSVLAPPATGVAPKPPVKTVLTVVLAPRKDAAAYRRRNVQAVLSKPTVVAPPPAPVVTKILVECVPVTHRRRLTRYRLSLPATLQSAPFDPCHPVLETIATTAFTPSAITPDPLSPTPLTADPLSLTPLAGDPLSLTPVTPDDLGAPDDPC